MYASTSSVYGANTKMPLSESKNTSCPISLYAATKKNNEIMAYSFSNIYKLPTTGIRLFTVYGPFGRPDMALHTFVNSIKNDKTIYLNNFGKHTRDFTYIDDVVTSIKKLIKKPSKKTIPSEIINIGSNKPKKLILMGSHNQNLVRQWGSLFGGGLGLLASHRTPSRWERSRTGVAWRQPPGAAGAPGAADQDSTWRAAQCRGPSRCLGPGPHGCRRGSQQGPSFVRGGEMSVRRRWPRRRCRCREAGRQGD